MLELPSDCNKLSLPRSHQKSLGLRSQLDDSWVSKRRMGGLSPRPFREAIFKFFEQPISVSDWENGALLRFALRACVTTLASIPPAQG